MKIASKASADSPIARRRLADPDRGRAGLLGLSHTLLRSNAYMQNTLALAAYDREDEQLRLHGPQGAHRHGGRPRRRGGRSRDRRQPRPRTLAGQTYWLTGPALISNYDVAAVLSELLGRTITYRELSFEENKDARTGAGIPEQIAEMKRPGLQPRRER